MRKIILIILVITISTSVFAKKNKYEEILVHTFDKGDGLNELGLITDGYSNEDVPSAMTFDKYDNLIIADTVNTRVIRFNRDFQGIDIYKDIAYVSGRFYIREFNDFIWSTTYSSSHCILNNNNGKSIELNINHEISNSSKTSIFTEKVLFTYLKDYSITSFILEDKVNLKYSSRLSEEETLALFRDKEKYGLDDYEIDAKNRIFYQGELLNRDYKTMYNYWSEQHSENRSKAPREVEGVPPFDKLNKARSTFIGQDKQGNIYRSGNTGCIIFDENGWVLDYFKFDNDMLISPAIDSNGNVYYISKIKVEGDYKLNMYKIERQW